MTEARYHYRTPPLHAAQVRALQKLVANRGIAGLLMDPGLGKSWVVVQYLAMLWTKYGSQDWLITAPLSALDGWPDQFAQHLPEDVDLELINLGDGWRNPGECLCWTKAKKDRDHPDHVPPQKARSCHHSIEEKAAAVRKLAVDRGKHGRLRVVLVNHDTFGSKSPATGQKDGYKLSTVTVWDRIVGAVETWRPDGAVVDESHRLKGHTSRRSKAFARLTKVLPKRILLTGTVTPRNPLDLFGQWQTLNPATFGTDWNAFRFRYAKWGGFHDKQPVLWLNTDEMREKLLADAFVAKKEDSLDLPPVTDITLPVRLSPKERKAYLEMGEEMLVSLPSGGEAIAPIPLTKMLRQRQLTGGFVGYETEDGGKAEERIGDSKARVCIDKLITLTDAGHKVVVFAHFRPDLDIIEELCAKQKQLKGVPRYRIDGSTAQKHRMAYREAFRDLEGPAIFIAQMRTMSLGVNELVVASYGIFYSLSERRDDYDQARDRLNRLGQSRPVTLYHLTVPDSVDELLLKGHQDKLDLERAITTRADAKRYLTLGESA